MLVSNIIVIGTRWCLGGRGQGYSVGQLTNNLSKLFIFPASPSIRARWSLSSLI